MGKGRKVWPVTIRTVYSKSFTFINGRSNNDYAKIENLEDEDCGFFCNW